MAISSGFMWGFLTAAFSERFSSQYHLEWRKKTTTTTTNKTDNNETNQI
jgi:hypothetical protein